MSNPLISVIVPVYNVAPYLLRCLDSLKSQSYRHLELILIDDGSTDDSGIICDDFARTDSRAIVIHQPNAGLSAARNSGLKIAKGEYVTFVDSDDFVAPGYVECLLTALKDSGSALSVCSHYERKENGDLKPFVSDDEIFVRRAFSVETALKEMLNEHGFMLSAWGKLYPRAFFESSPKIRFPVGKLHEDVGTTYKLFLRAYAKNPKATVAFSAHLKYFYNLHSTSITNRAFDPRKMDLVTQTDEMCDAIDKVFPNLKNTTNLRRLHARFSIIRQAKTARYLNPCIDYIKAHKSWLKNNPEATKRDKLALASLMLGKTAFKSSWKLYELIFK